MDFPDPAWRDDPLRLSYRQDVVERIMDCVLAGDSCVLVGTASTGKSNLLRFLLRSDVQHQYLRNQAESSAFLLIDSHSLSEVSEYGVYELILRRMVNYIDHQAQDDQVSARLHSLYRESVTASNRILAQRNVEMCVTLLCRSLDRKLVLMFDEFDELMERLDRRFFLNLRSIRDDFKYRICYIAATRKAPARIHGDVARNCEAFYELLAVNVYGLKPYVAADALEMVERLARRRRVHVSDEEAQMILGLAGGHPGLIAAVFDVGCRQGIPNRLSEATILCMNDPLVRDECERIWVSLDPDEQAVLRDVARGRLRSGTDEPVAGYLEAKGLVVSDGPAAQLMVFSPLFGHYVLTLPQASG